MTTLRECVDCCGLTDLQRDQPLRDSEWAPTGADRKAAWKLYVEMRTRIATQPLHFRSGDEETALTGVYQLFAFARKAMTEAGTEGRQFTALTTEVLNRVIRPFTAKWHQRLVDGHLAGEDVKHEFRAELKLLQQRLGPFQTALGRLAEGFDRRRSCWECSTESNHGSKSAVLEFVLSLLE